MIHKLKTRELAAVYENQGYDDDAFEIYSCLAQENPSNEIRAGLARMEKRRGEKKTDVQPEETISRLFEKWLMLMVLKQRLDNFRRIKSRLA
jgi:hypothetical protein